MTGQEIENIIGAVCLVGWIPIIAVFSGIAKVIVIDGTKKRWAQS